MNRRYHLRPTNVVSYCARYPKGYKAPTVAKWQRKHLRPGRPRKVNAKLGVRKKAGGIIPELKRSVQSHKNKVRTKVQKMAQSILVCPDCGNHFNSQARFLRHRRLHTGGNIFICGSCGDVFKTSTNLKKHEMIHTGEKPYNCDVCERSFRRFTYLFEHQLIHTDQKPFVCKVCNKAFRQSSRLRKHRQMHTLGEAEAKPNITEKDTLLASSVPLEERAKPEEQHPSNQLQNVHLNVFPFKCTRCQRSFNHFTHLQKHFKYHK